MADKKTKNGQVAQNRRKRVSLVSLKREIPLVDSRPVTHARLAAVMDAGDLRFANENFAQLLDSLDTLQAGLVKAQDRRAVRHAKAATWRTMNTLNELFQARATLVAFMNDIKPAGVH